MVTLQIISKILATQDLSIVENNLLTADYFVGYEDEYNYLIEHKKSYGNVPDKATFLSKFPEVNLLDVVNINIDILLLRKDLILNIIEEDLINISFLLIHY